MILNLESGLDISAAIERPRVHNQVVPTVTTIEVGPDGEDLVMNEDLKTRGHAIGVFDINLGVAEGGSPYDDEIVSDKLIGIGWQCKGSCWRMGRFGRLVIRGSMVLLLGTEDVI